MPVRPILHYPDPLLKTVCTTVPVVPSPELADLVNDLIDTMLAGPGSVGVAAPQIGVTWRVCVVDVSKNRYGKENNHGLLVLINPEVLGSDGTATMREGCMSVPDYTGDVQRATTISIRYLGPDGQPCTLEASGFEAVAIQHELDHLDGLLFLDRISSLKTGLFRRKNYK